MNMAVLGLRADVNMNGHSNIHSQLTKSLERILEDAHLSGELKLCGRKLREFPKPVNFDLSDTVVADLSNNRFNDVPEEVTTYIFMEKLLLSQNVIQCLPDAVGGLQSLTYLDLSSNQLTELPREICQMPLEVLLLSDNQLTALPKEIGRMTTLADLDASNNRLTQVPMTLGDCSGLRALDLSNNQLGLLPLQITYLRLEHLNVSCNCISSLPLELRNMSTLVTLNLSNNPLVSPPITVCMRGRVHIFKYLENSANKDGFPAHRRVEETRRNAKHNSYTTSPTQGNHVISSGNATIDCLRHKPRHAIDSGYSTDGVDKRCNDEPGGGGSGRSTPSTPSTLSPGAALSRTHSLSNDSPTAPLTPNMGHRISPEGNMSNGGDKSQLAHQQTYRQYKEALRQQRQAEVYRPRPNDQSPPDPDSPLHSNSSPTYTRTISSNSMSQSPSHVPNSPILHSTPRRFQNGNTEKLEENKRPVQKVVPSRNVNKIYTNGNLENGRTDLYTKPTSPTKSPTNTLGYNSVGVKMPRVNGDAKLSYLKGPAVKSKGWASEAEALSFTMKREFDKQKEESDLLHQLRTIIESRLKMRLPEELAGVLCDGVVLCHLVNHVRPRAVASVHVPSPAQPKLTMARCRRNVDNFLEACRKIGVEEEDICSADDILEPREFGPVARTLQALLSITSETQPDARLNNHYAGDTTERTIEVNYYRRHQRNRYGDNVLSNYFNTNEHAQYTIDESEEYALSYENNNDSNQYSPVYPTGDGIRNRVQYFQNNRVQFVMPFCKSDGVLKNDSLEIYDTDEVDFPMELNEEINEGRYDRGKMNLEIQNNLNRELTIETEKDEKHRFIVTCLCLGAFFLSAIILIIYPL